MFRAAPARGSPRRPRWQVLWPTRGRRRGQRLEDGGPPVESLACRSGISTDELDCLVLSEAGGVSKRLVDVSGLEIGIGLQDLFRSLPRRQQPEQPGYRKAQVADAGLARADVGPDRDPRELHRPS